MEVVSTHHRVSMLTLPLWYHTVEMRGFNKCNINQWRGARGHRATLGTFSSVITTNNRYSILGITDYRQNTRKHEPFTGIKHLCTRAHHNKSSQLICHSITSFIMQEILTEHSTALDKFPVKKNQKMFWLPKLSGMTGIFVKCDYIHKVNLHRWASTNISW